MDTLPRGSAYQSVATESLHLGGLNMDTELSQYETQAQDFLEATKTTLTVEYLKHDKYFPSDTEPRDIYNVTLKRGERSYTFTFGNSLNCSGAYKLIRNNPLLAKKNIGDIVTKNEAKRIGSFYLRENKNFEEPSAYNVLACLDGNDPGTFEDFCSNFGYDTDSRKAKKIYDDVLNQWKELRCLFTDDELKTLGEIN